MIREYQLTIGDICGDSTGLRVKVEDVDIYERVHFTVIEESGESDETDRGPGEMSYTAFTQRFTRLGNNSARGKAA